MAQATDKLCRRCKVAKPSSAYHKQERNSDGLQSYCKECKKAQVHRYYQTVKGREATRNNMHMNLALRNGLPVGDIPPDAVLLEEQEGVCFYCEQLIGGNPELHHVVPYCKGGGHTVDNVVLACKPCSRTQPKSQWPRGVPRNKWRKPAPVSVAPWAPPPYVPAEASTKPPGACSAGLHVMRADQEAYRVLQRLYRRLHHVHQGSARFGQGAKTGKIAPWHGIIRYCSLLTYLHAT